MRPGALHLPVKKACWYHTALQYQQLRTPGRKQLKLRQNAQTSCSSTRRVSTAAKWRDFTQSSQVAAKAFDQAEETSWRDKDDTAYVAEQQAITQSRWREIFTTRYDREIFAVLFPALMAIFLDPVMILIDTGTLWQSL